MRLSTDTDYSIRTLMLLASSEEPVYEEEIARRMQIPKPIVTGVMDRLKSKGFVCETERNEKEYRLAKNPDEISLWEMLSKPEGSFEERNARVRRLHSRMHNSMKQALSEVTLEKLVDKM